MEHKVREGLPEATVCHHCDGMDHIQLVSWSEDTQGSFIYGVGDGVHRTPDY